MIIVIMNDIHTHTHAHTHIYNIHTIYIYIYIYIYMVITTEYTFILKRFDDCLSQLTYFT